MSPRPLRRSQAVTPFGVGAMVDFPGPVSLLHAGLDAWPFDERKKDSDHAEFVVDDEQRLAARLAVDYFVQPPDYRYTGRGSGSVPNVNLKLPFLRFPRWHVCPRCGRMFESALHDVVAPECNGPIGSGKDKGKQHSRRRTVQVRFVAACEQGHLQDFPWWEWVFQTSAPAKKARRLRMNTTGSASLAGVRVICENDDASIVLVQSRTLAGAFDYEPGSGSFLSRIGVLCTGENPALGIPSPTMQAPGCGGHLYPLLRGSSNVYFPHVVSAIYLPPVDDIVDEEILEILDSHRAWQFFKMSAPMTGGKVTVEQAQAVLSALLPDRQIVPAKLAEAANRKLSGRSETITPNVQTDSEDVRFRRQEYSLFCRDIQEGYPKTNLLVRVQPQDKYTTFFRDRFQHVALLHKLRETRAFVGFARVFPDNSQTPEQRRKLIARHPKRWLPAVTVRGEGIFLVLKEDRLREWLCENSADLNARLTPMGLMLDQLRVRRRQEDRPVTPRFVLLHTLAHILINQFTYECGYGSASLRERIYCSDDDSNPMAGILIYTAAGDSEGTMGGLVRMGLPGRLEAVLQRAIEKARWCSTDPVCMESRGQGPDNCNLAACHACALLPETSCEEQNRLLDRGVIVGTLDSPTLGFFATGSIND